MQIDATQIRQWYDTMMAGQLVEIRMLSKVKGQTYSGIFNDADSIIRALQQFPDNGFVKGVYYTLNPLKDYCREWPQFGKIIQADKTANDTDIQKRSWLLIDIDPKRPSGINATDEEKGKAGIVYENVLKLISIELDGVGAFPEPKLAIDSGNGYHLLWRCDMENTPESAQAVRDFLQTLNNAFGTPDADVDTAVYNASRISKLPGTWARKGPDSQDRPHRMSKVFRVVPDNECDTVVIDDLRAVIGHFTPVASKAPETPIEAEKTPLNADYAKIVRDVESCLSQLENKGVRFPADREKWLTITAGWYHSLGADGLALFLRFSALWENNNPVEDRKKYLEMSRYPHNDGNRHPATIQKYFDLCRDYDVAPVYDWRQWQVDITQEQPAPVPLITRDGRMFLTRQNLCTIVGRPKAGKSTLLTSIVASAYTGRDFLGFSSDGHFKTLWIDTEQAPHDSTRMWRGVYRLAGVPPVAQDEKFIRLRLLDASVEDRIKCLEASIRETRPDLVIVDGVADLMKNTNDIEESQALVTDIRRINARYDCGIILILHVNWQNDKARGHLGTVLQQKSETVALLEHKGGMDSPTKVTAQLTRKAPFADFAFSIDLETGLPMLADAPAPIAPTIQTMLDCMTAGKRYRHKDIIQLMTGKGVKDSTARQYISRALDNKILKKMENGDYMLANDDDDDDLPDD